MTTNFGGRIAKTRQSLYQRLRSLLEKFVDRAWFPIGLGLLATLDLFIGIVPTDGLLLGMVLLRPRKWLIGAAAGAVGSGCGVFLLSLGVSSWAAPLVPWMSSHVGPERWMTMSRFLADHGLLGMGIIALSPIPQHPAVLLCAWSGLEPVDIALASTFGRMFKYSTIGAVTAYAPKLVRRLRGPAKELALLTHPGPTGTQAPGTSEPHDPARSNTGSSSTTQATNRRRPPGGESAA